MRWGGGGGGVGVGGYQGTVELLIAIEPSISIINQVIPIYINIISMTFKCRYHCFKYN